MHYELTPVRVDLLARISIIYALEILINYSFPCRSVLGLVFFKGNVSPACLWPGREWMNEWIWTSRSTHTHTNRQLNTYRRHARRDASTATPSLATATAAHHEFILERAHPSMQTGHLEPFRGLHARRTLAIGDLGHLQRGRKLNTSCSHHHGRRRRSISHVVRIDHYFFGCPSRCCPYPV